MQWTVIFLLSNKAYRPIFPPSRTSKANLSKIPTANFSNNEGYRFGKSQNPSTGILESQNFFQVGLQFQSNVDIFNWFSKKNTILANEWSLQAAKAATDKLKNDIALTVANSYLQVLLAREQQKIADVQVKQSAVTIGYCKQTSKGRGITGT